MVKSPRVLPVVVLLALLATGVGFLTAKVVDGPPTSADDPPPPPMIDGDGAVVEYMRYRLAVPPGKIADLTSSEAFAQVPAAIGMLTKGLELDAGDNPSSGHRIRGVITAPEAGKYEFFIAGNDAVELWINPIGVSRFGKKLVAGIAKGTGPREFTAASGQKSAALDLKAGQRIYFEVLQVARGKGGHASVGWLRPGRTKPEVVPASALISCAKEIWQDVESDLWEDDDADDDSLPDHWEEQFGLRVTNDGTPAFTDGEYGDPDGDKRTNFDEFIAGTNPVIADRAPGGMRREVWKGVEGNGVETLRGRKGPNRKPDVVEEIVGVESPRNVGNQYGERLRGLLLPTVAGEYTFWVAGNDQCELWLSTDEHPWTKRMIATTPTRWFAPVTGFHEWNRYGKQMSAPIRLEAGKKYYMEVFHKEGTGPDFVSVAWRVPGARLDVIPAAAVEVFRGDAGDGDDDGLADAWEKKVGLKPTNEQWPDGEGDDPDSDGLSNREEYQLSTDPWVVDTDGDGVSDADEVRVYKSDPVKVDQKEFTHVATLPGTAGVVGTGPWRREEETGDLIAEVGRGTVDYVLKIPTDGFYTVDIDLKTLAFESACPMRISLDGAFVTQVSPMLNDKRSTTVTVVLPFMKPGQHKVQLQFDNSRSAVDYLLRKVTLWKVRGADYDIGDKPGWIMKQVRARTGLTPGSDTSLTSPAFIEGKGEISRLTNPYGGGLVFNPAPDNGWYANVPLPEDGTGKNVMFDFENGLLREQRTISWAVTNVAKMPAMRIRRGDALRLSAFAGAQAGAGSVQLFLDDAPLTATTENKPFVHRFDADGKFHVRAEFAAADGSIAKKTMTVEVVSADFSGSPVALVNQWRTWDNGGIGPNVHVDLDAELVRLPDRQIPAPFAGAGGRKIFYKVPNLQNRYAVARLSPGGPIVAHTVMRAQQFFTGEDALMRQGERYKDGTDQLDASLVANNWQKDTEARVEIVVAGYAFEHNGLSAATFKAEDFNAHGIKYYSLIQAADCPTSPWHSVTVYQNGVRIGEIGE